MRKVKRILAILLALAILLPAAAYAAEPEETLDYSAPENWAYFEADKDKDVDVFLICPTVDTRSETNSFDLNDKLKKNFIYALDLERGIYEDTGRLFAPYYRQMSMNAYKLDEQERALAQEIAYKDISEAFRWYLDNENNGRGLILAGFSQGGQMCLELLKEYYGGESMEAQALRSNLIAVYAIGWSVTEKMTAEYPQIIPAQGKTDTGVVVSFDCEDGTLSDTIVIPEGTKALSINPLNWKTDGTVADRELNAGAVMGLGADPVPALCGAYIGDRGELVVTDVSPQVYPAGIDIFPEGSYHIYDYMFFFTNLKNNVAERAQYWRTGMPFKDVAAGTWYTPAVSYVYEKGLMNGTGNDTFSPAAELTRAQLVTILWRMAGKPVVNYIMPFSDVEAESWYTEAVRWAAAEKLIDSEQGAFGPAEVLRRDETAMLLWNYAKSAGADVSVGEDTNILSYDDVFDIEEEYIPAMQWAVGAGVIQGVSESELSPASNLTRAQAAVMLRRFADAA